MRLKSFCLKILVILILELFPLIWAHHNHTVKCKIIIIIEIKIKEVSAHEKLSSFPKYLHSTSF